MKGTDAIQYMMAGARLVAVGTAALRDPRAPDRILSEIQNWCEKHSVRDVNEIVGSLEWQS
jgi:dihydroorotate dehydrogenase (NAD+) catalytic subunit